jgi:PilZ domain
MIERRKITRSEVAQKAHIFSGASRSVLECTALNISGRGGKIALGRLYALPGRFLLSFDDFQSARSCRLVWSKGNFLGVQFCEASEPKAI